MDRPHLAMTVFLFLLPSAVFFGGVCVMSKISGPHAVKGQRPLNMRLFGYDTKDVSDYWGALDQAARRAEQRFLELDLLFPVFYGGALAVCFLATIVKLLFIGLCVLEFVWFLIATIMSTKSVQ